MVLPFGNRYAYLYQVWLPLVPETPLELNEGTPLLTKLLAVFSHHRAPSLVLNNTSKSIEPLSSSAKITLGFTDDFMSSGTDARSVASAGSVGKSDARKMMAFFMMAPYFVYSPWANDRALCGPVTRTVTR